MPSSFKWNIAAPHWVLTQALSAEAALGLELSSALWGRAVASAQLDLHSGEDEAVAWAHASLLELYLLRQLLLKPPQHALDAAQAETHALESARLAAAGARLNPYIIESTERQIDRYASWWRDELWRNYRVKINRPQSELWLKVDQMVAAILKILRNHDAFEARFG